MMRRSWNKDKNSLFLKIEIDLRHMYQYDDLKDHDRFRQEIRDMFIMRKRWLSDTTDTVIDPILFLHRIYIVALEVDCIDNYYLQLLMIIRFISSLESSSSENKIRPEYVQYQSLARLFLLSSWFYFFFTH